MNSKTRKRTLSAVHAQAQEVAQEVAQPQPGASERAVALTALSQADLKLIASCSAAVRDYCRGHR